jgi:hypothetical protein
MTIETDHAKVIKALAPGKGSVLAHIFNGVGNTTMLTAAAFGMRALLKKQDSDRTIIFASVASAAIGALWGWSEAKQVKQYRNAISDEIGRLHQEVDALKDENLGWKTKLAQKQVQETHAERQK